MLAPLALVFGLSFGAERLRPATAQILFWAYAALVGLSLGAIFMVFTHTSIVRVFFITAASFGALSLWGYSTPRDISGVGSFLIMGLFGVIIASVVNLFLHSSALQWAGSVVGVFVFAGLTAWDTQRLKNEYVYGAMDGETAERSAIMGASRSISTSSTCSRCCSSFSASTRSEMAATWLSPPSVSRSLSENSWFPPGNHLHPAARYDYIPTGFASACPAAFVNGR